MMINFTFKIKSSTTRGRLIKLLLSDNGLASCDQKVPLSNTCSTCSEDVDVNSTIICAICKDKYHVKCLTYALPTDFLALQSTNPCLWWFCTACVVSSEAAYQPPADDNTPTATAPENSQTDETSIPEDSSNGTPNQVDFMNILSEQFSLLKTELMVNINETIASKLSNCNNEGLQSNQSALYSDVTRSSTDGNNSSLSASDPNENVSQQQIVPNIQSPEISSPEILLLHPLETNSATVGAMNDVKKFVESKLVSSQVEFVHANNTSKKLSIGFRNSELRSQGESLINSNGVLTTFGYQSKNANKMLPKITITGIDIEVLEDSDFSSAEGDINRIRDLQKSVIVTKILNKNHSVAKLVNDGHTVDVVYLNKSKRTKGDNEYEELTIGLKVSPSVYRALNKQGGVVYLGNRRYKFSDRFYHKQCYHCQLMGHISTDCPEAQANKPPTCLYCMGKHRSATCTNKNKKDIHCCARCLASTYSGDAEKAKTHNAGSHECPVITRETLNLRARTEFTSKNVM